MGDTAVSAVEGVEGARAAFEARPEFAGTRMESTPLGDRHAAVDRITEELVLEVEDPAYPGWIENEMVDELLEGSLDGLGRQVHDPGQHIRAEAAPDDRADLGDRLGIDRSMRQTRQHRVLDRVGNRRLPNCQAVRASFRAERPEQLLDVEREAISPLVDGGRNLAWGGEPRIQEEWRDEGRVAR